MSRVNRPALDVSRARAKAFVLTALIVFAAGWVLSNTLFQQVGMQAGRPSAAAQADPALLAEHDRAVRQARDQAAAARRRVEAAEAELTALLGTHFSDWMHGVFVPMAEPIAAAPTPATPRTDHPEWLKLSDEVRTLEARRTAMLDRFTPEHPELQQLTLNLQQLQSRLEVTPRYQGGEAPIEASRQAAVEARQHAATSIAEQVRFERERRGQLVGSYDRLRAGLEREKAALARHESAERTAWERLRPSEASQVDRVDDEESPAEPGASIPLLLLLAGIAGMVAMCSVRIEAAEAAAPAFTLADLEQSLDLPIVAVLPGEALGSRVA